LPPPESDFGATHSHKSARLNAARTHPSLTADAARSHAKNALSKLAVLLTN
jgi:hypothetical protein